MRLLRSLALLSVALLAACASARPYATTVGLLRPGKVMTVRVSDANVGVYQPKTGDPSTKFTVAATARGKTTPAAPTVRLMRGGILVDAPAPLANLLVRVPDGVTLHLQVRSGHVELTNITGNADVTDARGDVQLQVPGYAQVAVGAGSIRATFGATRWPGTLHFSAQRGDITIWVNENASFHAHLHTDDGMLFSDFNLRGTSQGKAETIDAPVNGGGKQTIDIETHAGEIHLLRFAPQV